MPHQKHVKANRHNANRADANNNVHVPENNNNVPQAAPVPVVQHRQGNQRMQKCCMPGGCVFNEELIDMENVGDSMKVICNNEACTEGNWMHKYCFDEWEQSVLSYLRSCGRARSWSEKQRLQNLWTKKGYDLAFKACDCNCSRGHLRKDLDYIPLKANKKKAHKKKATTVKPDHQNPQNTTTHARDRRPSGNGNTVQNTVLPQNANVNLNNNNKVDNMNGSTNGDAHPVIHKPSASITIVNQRNDERIRANSISSTGSSPLNSASSTNSGSNSPEPAPASLSPQNGSVIRVAPKSKFDFAESNTNLSNTAAISIFRKRHDLSAFSILPKHKQNPYHIKMEDDALTGSDDVHTFVLNHLSSYKMTSLNCALCKNELNIFDRYPLIDGTLFLSPQSYDNKVLRVISEGRLQYINAVCVSCLEGGNDIRCAACKRKWDGSALLLGSMYSYDIFAAMPCCQKRLTCKHCRRAVVDVTTGLQFYSEYSHMIPCPYCKAYDYHFIRPLNETFALKMSIWN